MVGRITLSHFLLMFGYKLFSAYFALFLVERGLVLSQVGYSYFLIYIAFVLAAPFVGFLEHKSSPRFLSSLGILGYALYSLGMLFVPHGALFYFLQGMLGVAAAFFFVSSRTLLIRSRSAHPDASFGWFYSAPIYAEFLAPIAGGIILFFFGFSGVFIASIVFYFINIAFNMSANSEEGIAPKVAQNVRGDIENYVSVLKGIKTAGILPFIILGFSVVFVGGFYAPFFILYLQNLGLTQENIILYVAVFSAALIPMSLVTIKFLSKFEKSEGFGIGGVIHSLATLSIGLFGHKINMGAILGLDVFKAFGGFITSSKRSGIISRNFPQYPVEAGVIDSVLSPLGVALGALLGGLIVSNFGFQALFITGGAIVLTVTLLVNLFTRKTY